MSRATLSALIAHCRARCLRQPHLSDTELLTRFAQKRDPAAFEQLLERYSTLVWGVCRRILADEADREDAFQATFLALLRQAGSLDATRTLGGWLHTVAVRAARRAQSHARRQGTITAVPERPTRGDVTEEASQRELLLAVDEEIARLQAPLRMPMILCCLEGRTRDEAAAALGCSVAAIKSRLERGRALLRRRLERRGLALPAAFLVLELTGERIRAALWAETMGLLFGSPPPAAAALAAQVGLPVWAIGKIKLALLSLIIAFAVGTAGAIGYALTAQSPPAPATPPSQAKVAAKPKHPQVRKDRYGDPLPPGAVARLGTVRWRHGDMAFALAYSPNGKTIATTGVGRALVLWDADTGKELRVFSTHGQPLGVAFSPDGKWIATTQRWGQLWNVATGEMRDLKNLQSGVLALAFAPDGKTLATANSDGLLHLWDPNTAEEKRRIDCKQGRLSLNALAYAPNGRMLASGGTDGTIRFWDAATGREVRRIATPEKTIAPIVFSPDGKQLAAGSAGDSLRLWDVATGKLIRALGEKQQGYTPIAFSPDGKLLAVGYGEGTYRLWDVASGEEKRHWHAGVGRVRNLAFSPDGQTLATTALWDGGIRLWDVKTGRERFAAEAHHGPIPVLRFADKGTLVSAGFDETVLWWDLATQTPRRQFAWKSENFTRFTLSPDGNTLAAVGNRKSNELWLWDVRSGKSTKMPDTHPKEIHSLAFSPDGRLLAAGGKDGTIHVRDVATGKEVGQIQGFAAQNSAMCLLFSPDGKTLASGAMGFPNNVIGRLWDVASGKEHRVFADHLAGESPAAFSPDGKVLATVNDPPRSNVEYRVRLWDMTTGKELCRHTGHRISVAAVAFSPDGKLVASGGGGDEDNSIHIWEAATGRLIRRFKGHHSWVFAVAFAADGLTVASSAGDSTVLVWDITGRRIDGRWHSKALTPRELDACWKALADADATKAYDAVWKLVAAPEQAVPFLRNHLRPMRRPDAKAVGRLLADLDSEVFTVRRKANEELSQFGDAINPELRQALAAKPTLEVRRRVQQLLDRAGDWTVERLRHRRAIQALEYIGTKKAKQILDGLAAGAPDTLRTEDAKAVLRRLKR